MPDIFCFNVMKSMNQFFDENDRVKEEALREKLMSEESIPDIINEVVQSRRQLRKKALELGMGKVVENWPAEHHPLIRSALLFAIDQRRAGKPLSVRWNGDDESAEFTTRIEITNGELLMQFTHPPAQVQRRSA